MPVKDKWKDATSYSRSEGDAAKRTPRSWALGEEHRERVLLHRHVHDPGGWFVTCYALDIEQHRLVASELPDAKIEALEFVSTKLRHKIKYYERLGVKL